MWEGFIVATICSGWLCKVVHGEEFRHPLRGRFDTEELCRREGELVLSFAAIDPALRPRVECINNARK